jgi:hypothetical protein
VAKHILDKQILDVNGAKVVRVNDLKLGERDGAIMRYRNRCGVKRHLAKDRRWEGGAENPGFPEETY